MHEIIRNTDCALCGTRHGLAHSELRPTGKDGQLETWWYCARCWEWVVRTRKDTDIRKLLAFFGG